MTKLKFASTLALISATVMAGLALTPANAADEPKADAPAAAPAAGETKAPEGAAPAAAETKASEGAAAAAPAAAGGTMTTFERVNATEVGKLKNPYTGNAAAAEEGKKLYLANSCNGCHGGGGGGGMCPPLTNQTWVYGSDDDTIFRLITLGSKDLGRPRKGSENVKGPMPGYKDIITKEDDLWKIIAWMRTLWKHGDAKKDW